MDRKAAIQRTFCPFRAVMLQRAFALGLIRQHHFPGNFTARHRYIDTTHDGFLQTKLTFSSYAASQMSIAGFID
jgi:hypothetical protein